MKRLEEENTVKIRLKNQINSLDFSIKEKNSEHQQQGQFNNMFSNIMKANIPGVLGRLGDLGSIPTQYDSILTTSCSRLDNIVVEDYNAAQAVLSLLKKNDLGRVTCIILDKIQSSR